MAVKKQRVSISEKLACMISGGSTGFERELGSHVFEHACRAAFSTGRPVKQHVPLKKLEDAVPTPDTTNQGLVKPAIKANGTSAFLRSLLLGNEAYKEATANLRELVRKIKGG